MSPKAIATRMSTAWSLAMRRKRARERFAAARRELDACKEEFEIWAHRVTYRRWARAQVEYDHALAQAQEWGVVEASETEAWR